VRALGAATKRSRPTRRPRVWPRAIPGAQRLGVLSVEAGDLDRAGASSKRRSHRSAVPEARLNLAVAEVRRDIRPRAGALHALLAKIGPIAKRQPKQPHSCAISAGPDRFCQPQFAQEQPIESMIQIIVVSERLGRRAGH